MINAFYRLSAPVAPPDPPRRWSFTTLAAWRACPRRWWLENARYPGAAWERYPQRVMPATVTGQLVHKAVEVWLKGEPGFMAKRAVKALLPGVLRVLRTNPRVDVGRLEAAISIDACVDKFFALTRGLSPSAPPVARPSGTSSDTPPVKASEFWVEVDTPPVCGRIDRVADGTLTDFKSGEPDLAAHSAQLRFYAVLWHLRYKVAPDALELRYPSSVHPVEVPALAALKADAFGLAEEIGQAAKVIPLGPPEAKPSVENCRYCPVRHLCDEYWNAPATTSLRALPMSGAPAEPRDVLVTRLPSGWKAGVSCRGGAAAYGLGDIVLDVPDSHCPSDQPAPKRVRLLGALTCSDDKSVTVRATTFTEAFWA